jgi:hypothetical protein
MAIVDLNPMFDAAHGRLNELVFRRTSSGKTSVIKRADMSNVEWSEAQKDQRLRFRAANDYAKVAMADERLRLIYEQAAEESGRSPYRVAFSDFFQGRKLINGTDK